MNRSRIAIASLTAFALLLILAVSCATAKPKIASGSNCNASWVNNAGAMACFIQGEEEANAGAAHPHYVACSAAGEIFCCQDNDRGAQDCVATASTRPPSKVVWTRAILAAQRAHLKIAESPAVKSSVRKRQSAR
ncbi:MAG TPA: hypothetical protein VKG24_19750 [Pseudolabrys sp.]|nr:hypothetical protein [Pseudolabrys sp.]